MLKPIIGPYYLRCAYLDTEFRGILIQKSDDFKGFTISIVYFFSQFACLRAGADDQDGYNGERSLVSNNEIEHHLLYNQKDDNNNRICDEQ